MVVIVIFMFLFFYLKLECEWFTPHYITLGYSDLNYLFAISCGFCSFVCFLFLISILSFWLKEPRLSFLVRLVLWWTSAFAWLENLISHSLLACRFLLKTYLKFFHILLYLSRYFSLDAFKILLFLIFDSLILTYLAVGIFDSSFCFPWVSWIRISVSFPQVREIFTHYCFE